MTDEHRLLSSIIFVASMILTFFTAAVVSACWERGVVSVMCVAMIMDVVMMMGDE